MTQTRSNKRMQLTIALPRLRLRRALAADAQAVRRGWMFERVFVAIGSEGRGRGIDFRRARQRVRGTGRTRRGPRGDLQLERQGSDSCSRCGRTPHRELASPCSVLPCPGTSWSTARASRSSGATPGSSPFRTTASGCASGAAMDVAHGGGSSRAPPSRRALDRWGGTIDARLRAVKRVQPGSPRVRSSSRTEHCSRWSAKLARFRVLTSAPTAERQSVVPTGAWTEVSAPSPRVAARAS